ncbi:phage tail sheath family protein [Halomonas ramblicola]|uniref:phage tail sheath family protein n=1 Tax=Halomonas ramblicola TaxID=747349 RepID=UPI0025B6093F|nr:phage tail sheath C-terminal domain-containing protein [Halomonas ramblicola]MDN3522565.1 phage tail sheath C-terminal domain-containing protein [Halomonas ramblicola]
MAQVSYPGVYVDEVSSGVRPISAASTSTAAFIGQAEKGSLTEAKRIFNFTEFENQYGGFLDDSYLAHAVYQFFNNGGAICYVVRVAGENVETANIVLSDRADTPQDTLTIEAVSPGQWGNELELVVTDGTVDPGNEFTLEVYQGDASTPTERFEDLSMVPNAPNFVEKVTNASTLIRVTADPTNTNAVAGTSRGGGTPTLPLTSPRTQLRININADGYQTIDLQEAVTDGTVDNLDDLGNVVAALNARVQALSPLRSSTDPAAFTGFTASDDGGVLLLTSGTSGVASSVSVARAADSNTNATSLLRLGRLEGGTETQGGAVTRPVVNSGAVPRYRVGDHGLPAAGISSVRAGSDGDPITTDLPYIEAFGRLDDKDDVSLIAVPGIGSANVVGEGMAYCESRSLSDCFFIGDMGLDVDTTAEAQSFVAGLSPKNSYGALYLPWATMVDPTGQSPEPIPVPPSGFVAGMYAKTDARRGVWKAPAGTESALAGTAALVVTFTDAQQGLLNPAPYNINVIRQFAASGRVLWGARTITSDAEWRYIPVRRTAIMLRVSIYRGIQWAVFEPNDVDLWQQLRLNISAFMMTLFRQGAFQGATADQGFFVKCDAETTTQADIDNGVVNVLVGFAPLKPAEFVVVKLSQKAGQSA